MTASEKHLEGPIHMPVCPDCHSPLVQSDDPDLLWCNECREYIWPPDLDVKDSAAWFAAKKKEQQTKDQRIVEMEAELDKWEWVARDACADLAYETHVNPQSPLDYRLAQWQTREGGGG